MHRIISGKPVRDQINSQVSEAVAKLKAEGVVPGLATLRVGEDPGQKYYESSVIKQTGKAGIDCRTVVLPPECPQEEVEKELIKLNEDPSINGILMLMPFPKHLDSDRLVALLDPSKDIDAITDKSYAGLFQNKRDGFFACTAEACMEMLKYHDIPVKGARVAIAGRSLRVGKPLMLMMMNANATVTVCHTRTRREDMEQIFKESDIIVLATGVTEGYDSSLFRNGQVIVDVGTGTGKDGKMAGDFDVKSLESNESLTDLTYTPVPGGVGTITTALLLRHLTEAAREQNRK